MIQMRQMRDRAPEAMSSCFPEGRSGIDITVERKYFAGRSCGEVTEIVKAMQPRLSELN